MANSLDLWEVQLWHWFQKDWLEIQEEVDKLQFQFFKEDTLGLQQYIQKKINLYEESGITDQDELVQRIWRGLDPIMMNSIRPLAGDNSLEEFISALYEQEFSARRVWQTMGNHRWFGGHMAVLTSEGQNMTRTIGDWLPAITTSTREPSQSAWPGASTSWQLPYSKK